MKIFQCTHCKNPVYFENTSCEKCGNQLGYLFKEEEMLSFPYTANQQLTTQASGKSYTYCSNQQFHACNWLVPAEGTDTFCEACATNNMIPDLSFQENKLDWQKIEAAKRRLFYSLKKLNLPVSFELADQNLELSFDFLASDPNNPGSVKTGHANGRITLNINEADAVHREYIKEQLSERYRTLLGHFRHEVGHFYWDALVKPNPKVLQEFRALFGDDSLDYGKALEKHYREGPPQNWRKNYISSYATMHPWEDWAETWAHYLHLMDMLETAYHFGLEIDPELKKNNNLDISCDFDPYEGASMRKIIKHYLPLTYVVNSLSRSMGAPDLYPFVISEPVIKKLDFIHRLVLD